MRLTIHLTKENNSDSTLHQKSHQASCLRERAVTAQTGHPWVFERWIPNEKVLFSRRGTIFSHGFNVSKFKSSYIFHVGARVRYCCTARNELDMSILREWDYVHLESLVNMNVLPTAAHTLRSRLIIWATWLLQISGRIGTPVSGMPTSQKDPSSSATHQWRRAVKFNNWRIGWYMLNWPSNSWKI